MVHPAQEPVGLAGSISRRTHTMLPCRVIERPKPIFCEGRALFCWQFCDEPTRISIVTWGRHVAFRKVTCAACAGTAATIKHAAASNVRYVLSCATGRWRIE